MAVVCKFADRPLKPKAEQEATNAAFEYFANAFDEGNTGTFGFFSNQLTPPWSFPPRDQFPTCQPSRLSISTQNRFASLQVVPDPLQLSSTHNPHMVKLGLFSYQGHPHGHPPNRHGHVPQQPLRP